MLRRKREGGKVRATKLTMSEGGVGPVLIMLAAVVLYRVLLALAGARPKMHVTSMTIIAMMPLVLIAFVLIVFYKIVEKYVVQPIKSIINFVKDLPEEVWNKVKDFFEMVINKLKNAAGNLAKKAIPGMSQDVINMRCSACVEIDPDDEMNPERVRCELRCMMQDTLSLPAPGGPFVQHTKRAPPLAITL